MALALAVLFTALVGMVLHRALAPADPAALDSERWYREHEEDK